MYIDANIVVEIEINDKFPECCNEIPKCQFLDNNGFFYGSGSRKITCKLLALPSHGGSDDPQVRNYLSDGIGGGIPKVCFRVPNSNPRYKKCDFFKEENKKWNPK